MLEIPPDYRKIRKRIEKDKIELEKTGRELKELGRSLKEDYIRQIRESLSGEPGTGTAVGSFNRMCLGCFKSCKQPAGVKIYKCAMYEPIL